MTFGDGFGLYPNRGFNATPIQGGMFGQDRQTFFDVGDKINDIINIDEHDSDDGEIDFDKYNVNMDTGDSKRKYKRLYDSKYKYPPEKKLQHIANKLPQNL